jgi:hypothetical protein
MTNDSLLKNSDIIRNSLESSNRIKLNLHKGILRGNIIDIEIDEVVLEECVESSLNFNCPGNSQYIPLL